MPVEGGFVTFEVSFSNLATLGPNARRHLEQAGQDFAEEIAESAQFFAPVRSGALREGVGVVKTGPLQWEIVSAAPYSPYVEGGTVKMQAQPFMGPAMDIARTRVRTVIVNAFRRGLRK